MNYKSNESEKRIDSSDNEAQRISHSAVTNDRHDFTIPMIYHSESAEVQRVIDKISIKEPMVPSNGNQSESLRITNQLSFRRQRQEAYLQNALKDSGSHTVENSSETMTEDHLVSLDMLETKIQTNRVQGLTEEQVKARLLRDGLNVLTPPKSLPMFLQFVKCLFAGFGIILWVAACLCILAYKPLGDPPDIYNIILAVVIVVVISVQATFFFTQERKSSNLMSTYANMIPTYSHVLRSGMWQRVESCNLVVGDVVRLIEGDKVPADIRLFEVNQAKVEKSGLTGENEPVPLSTTATDPNLYETRNLALFGTSMVEGSAVGIVISTSDKTVMGNIAKVVSKTSCIRTGLQRELNFFTCIVTVMAVIACIIIIGGYYLFIQPKNPNFLSISSLVTECIAVVVSLLPEGSPVALALTLTMVARRMYEKKILVKKLTVLETLGSTTLIASDKTGTLTQNQMTLNHIWLANSHSVNLNVIDRKTSGMDPSCLFLFQIMALCNKCFFDKSGKVIGNPTEAALLKAVNGQIDVNDLRGKVPIAKEIAFSSRTKFHVTVHQVDHSRTFRNSLDLIKISEPNYEFVVFVKGAPEYVLSMCSKAVVDSAEVVMDESTLYQIMKANEFLASNGQRVLAFAYRTLDSYLVMDNDDGLTSDLCFLGLAGIIDPPREGVAEAINICRQAKLRVMMVTGDQRLTAVAIAKSVNIITKNTVKTIADVLKDVPAPLVPNAPGMQNKIVSKVKSLLRPQSKRHFRNNAIIISGPDVDCLSEKQWDYILLHKEVVFARTTPQQKMQIVKESRLRGDIVAVTGDGVNDAPALKAADIGIAMGVCGSNVSKEAANMVLLDDNFVTIVKGIKEGRLLFENLKKVICYLFPSGSMSEILPVFAAVFFGMPVPLSTFLMIVICVGTDMIGSLGMIHEEAESDLMTRPPRNTSTDRLVTWRTILFAYFFIGLMESSIAFFMYFLTMWVEGRVPPSKLLFAYDNWGQQGWVDLTSMEQVEIVYKAQTAFFVSLVMTQLWNMMAVRTRYQSIFHRKFHYKLFYYMLGEVAVVLMASYLPVINQYMYTRPAQWYQWVVPLVLGSIILISDELRKYFVRKYPKSLLKKLAW